MAKQVEYKRFKNWDELAAEEFAVFNKLKTTGKLRAMEGLPMTGIIIEHALSRLGKEGWQLAYVSRDGRQNIAWGIFVMREVEKSPDIAKIEDLIGPTPGNSEPKLPITP